MEARIKATGDVWPVVKFIDINSIHQKVILNVNGTEETYKVTDVEIL